MSTTSAHKKRASLHTLGCRLNQSETNLLAEQLVAQGYELVPFGDPADLAIINTCTVTQEADAKSRKLLRQFIRKNPDAYTAVIGCYAQMGAGTLAKIGGVDLIIGNSEKMNVLDYVQAGKNAEPLIIRDKMFRDDFTIDFMHETGGLTRRANLKVQDGCDFMCSFCIIPFARGRARSRALDNLVDEARALTAQGSKELVLTGVNLGTYAYQDKNIVHVMDALAEIEDLARIRLSSIEPTTIPIELLDRMADPAHPLVPHLHIPLQSGSNRVLTAMRRRYTREEFFDFITEANRRVPGLCIGTDTLVGFPGETEAEFQETYALLEESPLAYAHVFKYSERSGTATARMPEKLGPDVANNRSARLRRLGAQKTRSFQQQYVGCTLDVLFEQVESGYGSGYTENYIRVIAPSDMDVGNTVLPVKLQKIRGDLVVGSLLEGAVEADAKSQFRSKSKQSTGMLTP